MRLGVPFIALRQLGAVGGQLGRPNLPFCRVVHRTVTVAVWCAISFLFWRIRPLQLWARWCTGHCLVHTGQSGAPCRPLELPRVTRRLRSRPLALVTVGSPDSPVNYSRTPPSNPESSEFIGDQPGAPDTVRCTTGQSGVPDRTRIWLHTAKSFAIRFSSSQHCF